MPLKLSKNLRMTKMIKVYGERNTNTNYLEKLIELNLAAKIAPALAPRVIRRAQRILPGNEWLVDLYTSYSFDFDLGWKHAYVPTAERIKKTRVFKNNDIGFVTIVKNPYSWLLSLHRRPYHQYYSEKPDFVTFLQTPWKTVARDLADPVIAGPVELWNIKNAAYARLNDLNVIHTKTELIFENPERIIEQIGKQFTIERKASEFEDFQWSTKGTSHTASYYSDYYLNEKWKEELSQDAIAIINKKIDRSLMDQFGYELL